MYYAKLNSWAKRIWRPEVIKRAIVAACGYWVHIFYCLGK